MEGCLLSPPPPPNHVLCFLFQVSEVLAVPKMMGRVPRWLGVRSKVFLVVPKPLWAVLVVEESAPIAAQSAQCSNF